MEKTALLVVDVQTALIAEHPYREKETVETIREIISWCRNHQIEVIYARHDGGTGDELERNAPGWQIYGPVAPAAGEAVFDKQYNSAFRETGLRDYLDRKGIRRLILTGMQTEYCIDATCKVAFEFGYHVVVPEGATTTVGNSFLSGGELCAFYTEKIWNRRFADLVPMERLKAELENP